MTLQSKLIGIFTFLALFVTLAFSSCTTNNHMTKVGKNKLAIQTHTFFDDTIYLCEAGSNGKLKCR